MLHDKLWLSDWSCFARLVDQALCCMDKMLLTSLEEEAQEASCYQSRMVQARYMRRLLDLEHLRSKPSSWGVLTLEHGLALEVAATDGRTSTSSRARQALQTNWRVASGDAGLGGGPGCDELKRGRRHGEGEVREWEG